MGCLSHEMRPASQGGMEQLGLALCLVELLSSPGLLTSENSMREKCVLAHVLLGVWGLLQQSSL